jgi:hypothetical protein
VSEVELHDLVERNPHGIESLQRKHRLVTKTGEWIDGKMDVFIEVGLGTRLVLEEPFPSFAVGSDPEDGCPPDDLTVTTKG